MESVLRCDDQPGPAFAGMRVTLGVRYRFERTYNCRAYRDHALTMLTGVVHCTRCVKRHTIIFLIGWLMTFQAGDTRMQDQRRDLHATRHEPGDQVGRKRAPGGWHLGAARLGG